MILFLILGFILPMVLVKLDFIGITRLLLMVLEQVLVCLR